MSRMSRSRAILMGLVAVAVVMLGIDNLLSGDPMMGWYCVVGGSLFGVVVLITRLRTARDVNQR